MSRQLRAILPASALLLVSSFAFVHLTALPMFEDEGSQLHLTWRILEAREWLAPLTDGKPLESWLMVPLIRLGPQPLILVRTLHVLAGMMGAVLTYHLGLQVTDRRTAFVSGFMFVICPFVVYLQRLALSDILLCAAGTWVLVCVGGFIRAATRANAAGLACALLLSAFCKMPVGFIFVIAMPLALLLMPGEERRHFLRQPALGRMAAAHTPALVLAACMAILAVIRIRQGRPPGFGLADLMGVGMGQYRGIAETIGLPRPNLLTELTAQLSWPVAIIGLLGLIMSVLWTDWRHRWLIAVGALPLLAIGLLASFWYSRYLLFTFPPLIVAAVSGWHRASQRIPQVGRPLQFAALGISVAFMGRQSALLILAPGEASWSALDRFQYIEGWGSGYGYPEAAQFLLAAPETPPIIYSLDGHSAYQLRNYLPAAWNERVEPISYGLDGKMLHTETERAANLFRRTPAWIIVAEPLLQSYLNSSFGPQNIRQFRLRPIVSFAKPGTRARLALYEVTPRSAAEPNRSTIRSRP